MNTSIKHAAIISIAPHHAISDIASSGKKILALTTAISTSDIISRPTLPGNKNFCAQKIIQTEGRMITNAINDEIGMTGNMSARDGGWKSPIKKPSSTAATEVKKN